MLGAALNLLAEHPVRVGLLLPRQAPVKHFQPAVHETLQIISAAGLYSKVAVDRHVQQARLTLHLLFVRDVRSPFQILLASGQSDEVEALGVLPCADHELLEVYGPMKVALGVEKLEAPEHLIGQHDESLHLEDTPALLEEGVEGGGVEGEEGVVIFGGGSCAVAHSQSIIYHQRIALLDAPQDARFSQEGVGLLAGLQLHRKLLPVLEAEGHVDVGRTSLPDLSDSFVLILDDDLTHQL